VIRAAAAPLVVRLVVVLVVLGSGSVESVSVVLVEVVRWWSILARVRGSRRGRGGIR
jgi:hypothetical protein